jgi:hypothetical protein
MDHEILHIISWWQFPIGFVLLYFCVIATYDFPARRTFTVSAFLMFFSAIALVKIVNIENAGVSWTNHSGANLVYACWFLGTPVSIILLLKSIWTVAFHAIRNRREVRLPDPLLDPLYAAWPVCILWALGILVDLLILSDFSPTLASEIEQSPIEWAAAFALLLVSAFAIVRLFPKRTTNAIILRSFVTDDGSAAIQRSIRGAVGGEFRLSGIRQPRRRVSVVVRTAFIIVMLFRYARTRFMNLEAEADWRARLWRSLADVRVVFLDVREMTKNLEFEVRLAYGCVGLNRMCFIGDTRMGTDEWKAQIHSVIEEPDPRLFNIVLWSPSNAPRFEKEISSFVLAAPAQPAGLVMASFESVAPDAPSKRAVLTRLLLDFCSVIVGTAVLMGVAVAYTVLELMLSASST